MDLQRSLNSPARRGRRSTCESRCGVTTMCSVPISVSVLSLPRYWCVCHACVMWYVGIGGYARVRQEHAPARAEKLRAIFSVLCPQMRRLQRNSNTWLLLFALSRALPLLYFCPPPPPSFSSSAATPPVPYPAISTQLSPRRLYVLRGLWFSNFVYC